MRLFGVYTTLSATLLWASGLYFAIALSFSNESTEPKSILFLGSRVAVFGYLGPDDRIQAHEWIALKISTHSYYVGDNYILLTVGLLEIGSLWFLGRRYLFKLNVFILLALAASLFVIMIVFDAAMPQDMMLRLTIEDLCKSWAGLAFFVHG